jgi:hypothetical protein
LAEENPTVAGGAPDIRRKMIATDKFHATVGDVLVCIFGSDLVIIVNLKPVLLPRSGLIDHVQKHEVAVRPIGEMYSVHCFFSFR